MRVVKSPGKIQFHLKYATPNVRSGLVLPPPTPIAHAFSILLRHETRDPTFVFVLVLFFRTKFTHPIYSEYNSIECARVRSTYIYIYTQRRKYISDPNSNGYTCQTHKHAFREFLVDAIKHSFAAEFFTFGKLRWVELGGMGSFHKAKFAKQYGGC